MTQIRKRRFLAWWKGWQDRVQESGGDDISFLRKLLIQTERGARALYNAERRRDRFTKRKRWDKGWCDASRIHRDYRRKRRKW